MANRPEHWLSDLALVRLGAVPVSVYGTAAPEQITHIARNCRARLAVVGGAEHLPVWEPLLADADTPLERLVVADAGRRRRTCRTRRCNRARCRRSSTRNSTPPGPRTR